MEEIIIENVFLVNTNSTKFIENGTLEYPFHNIQNAIEFGNHLRSLPINKYL